MKAYTLNLWMMDGESYDPCYSYDFNNKDDLIRFLETIVLDGGHEGRLIENMHIRNNRTKRRL